MRENRESEAVNDYNKEIWFMLCLLKPDMSGWGPSTNLKGGPLFASELLVARSVSTWKWMNEYVTYLQEGYIEEMTRFSHCLNAKTGFVNYWSVHIYV